MRAFRKILIVILAVCLAVGSLPAQSALADDEITANTPWPDMDELHRQVEEATAIYEEVSRKVEEVQKEIEALNERIKAILDELPRARRISDEAAKEYYLLLTTSDPFLEMIFGATSLKDFFAKVEYTTRLNQSYLNDISALKRLTDELEAARLELEAKKEALIEEQRHAEEALLDAENAQRVAEETTRLIAEATAAATAAAAAAVSAVDANTPHVPNSVLPPSGPGLPESPSEKQLFVDLWTPRIDAYLAGSPLAGYGYAFANAAYDYGVDPRWSPAIACLESSKGLYNFLPYNAWGWGQVSWPDWETAIYAHVRGLSIGYGYTISEAAAKKYCPYNWEYWYAFVSNQMTLI